MAQRSRSRAVPEEFTAAILDSIADGVFTVDRRFRVTSFNRAAEEITGVPREEAIGARCSEIFRTNICESGCILRRTMETGRALINQGVYAVVRDGTQVPISVSTAVLRDGRGVVVGGAETFRNLTSEVALRKEQIERSRFAGMISRNHRMRAMFDILPEVSESPATVLIEGPSGSGKELVARAIHDLSARRSGPLVTVNCGALPDTLLESELFGYEAGAFTDARRDKPGRFELARGGTIFLDEIGDVTPAMQVRLLRVLEDGVFEPLGSTRQVRTDARVLAATNRDVDRMVADGTFREDLYYRLNVVRLRVPPLGERKEDIPLLVDHFLTRMREERGKEIQDISHGALGVLMQHDFPGNVRELENVIEYAFIVCPSGTLELEHLPHELRERHRNPSSRPRGGSMAELEAQFLHDALARNDFNRAATARELGIHKTTLWRKMKKLGVRPPDRGE